MEALIIASCIVLLPISLFKAVNDSSFYKTISERQREKYLSDRNIIIPKEKYLKKLS